MKIGRDPEALMKLFMDRFWPTEDVRPILQEVRDDGDAAVVWYTERFDDVRLGPSAFQVCQEELRDATDRLDDTLRHAAGNIRRFSERQLSQLSPFSYESEGVEMGQTVEPISSVGVYIPGGRYPLVSTALMTIIPASVAGVEEIIACTPPGDEGMVPKSIRSAVQLAGADALFRIGGVQAIGAMTYGTQTVPAVDKIVGPGNTYVTAAKKLVYGRVGIDGLAGPSEVLVLAGPESDPDRVAAELVAQAEHDEAAKVAAVVCSRKTAQAVRKRCRARVDQSAGSVAAAALKNAYVLVVDAYEEMVALSNAVAPEHLVVNGGVPEEVRQRLSNYGSLFLGDASSVVFGDYSAGTNHVLPTAGAARYSSGLSPLDFVRTPTWQSVRSVESSLVETTAALAEAEGMEAHRRAALLRETESEKE